MCKVLTIAIMMVLALSANAQGEWRTVELEGDPLKGTESGTAYIYEDPEIGSFVFWGFDKFQYRITVAEGQFNINAGYNRYGGSYAGLSVSVGLYDDNNKLKEMFKMWLDRESNSGNTFLKTRDSGVMNNPVGQKGKVKKIFNALKSGSGYVRIVAERYNTTDFDLKITPFK